MSYVIDTVGAPCVSCGRSFNPAAREHPPAYNLWRVFDFAIFGEVRDPLTLRADASDIRSLNGRVAGETSELLAVALRRLRDASNAPTVAALAPRDGGESIVHAIETLRGMRDHARKFPKHVWRII